MDAKLSFIWLWCHPTAKIPWPFDRASKVTSRGVFSWYFNKYVGRKMLTKFWLANFFSIVKFVISPMKFNLLIEKKLANQKTVSFLYLTIYFRSFKIWALGKFWALFHSRGVLIVYRVPISRYTKNYLYFRHI